MVPPCEGLAWLRRDSAFMQGAESGWVSGTRRRCGWQKTLHPLMANMSKRWDGNCLDGRKATAQKFRKKIKKKKDDADAVNYVCILFKVWEMAAARESGRGCDRFVTESVTGEGRLELTFLLSWLCRWRSCKLGIRSEAGQVHVAAQLNMVQPFFVPWQTVCWLDKCLFASWS